MLDSVLWAITSYFNPVGYRRRFQNFQEFRRRLTVPLLAVELGYNGQFELRNQDAELLVRLSGRDVLWQKERLLNVAMARLPAACTTVASVDCDVIFEHDGWADEALALLERFPMIQLFSRVHHLRRDWAPDRALGDAVELTQEAIARAASRSPDPALSFGNTTVPGPGAAAMGFGWAYRRDVLARHGFYDVCIVGGGNTAMLGAGLGRPDSAIQVHAMNAQQESMYREWASAFHRSIAGRVGFLGGDVFHLWHGRLEDRWARRRHLDLGRFGFDPRHDIALDEAGCWRWNSDKRELHAYVRDYFLSRREDG
jgi:hypothetical protein